MTRIHERPRRSPVAAVSSGVRWGATHESRLIGRRIQSALGIIGVRPSAGARRVMVGLAWAGGYLGLIAGSLADPVRLLPTIAPWLAPWWSTLLVAAGLAVAAGSHSRSRRSIRRHRQLLSTGRGRGVGLIAGLSLAEYPALAVVAAQSVRCGTPATLLLAVAMLAAVATPLVCAWAVAGGHVLGRWTVTAWASALTAAGLQCLMVFTSTGPDALAAVRLGPWASAVAISLLAASVTVWVARGLGRTRLAPRSAHADRQAGVLTAAGLGIGWMLQEILAATPWAAVRPAAPLLAAFAVALLLRTRHVRFTSPEARGYGLFLVRDASGMSGRVLRHYAVNAMLLLAPTMIATAAQLLLIGAAPTLMLLLALWALEVAGDVVVVQRRAAVLPAHALNTLGLASRSGLAAAGCFAVAATATGVAGFQTPFHFDDPTAVAGVAGLLLASAALLTVLAALDSSGWLEDLKITRPEEPA